MSDYIVTLTKGGKKLETMNVVLNHLIKGQSCSLYGDRRAGKTTLALKVRKELEQLGFKVIYIDCGLIYQQEYLWRMMVDKFSLDYAGQFNKMDYYEFTKALKNNSNRKLLILDEFELLIANKNISVDVFNFLRAIANPEINLIYMTISEISICDLMIKKFEFVGSPFWNIFTEHYVS